MSVNYFETRENPFLIDIADDTDYSMKEWTQIQQKLREKEPVVSKFISELYPTDQKFNIPKDTITRRVKQGFNASLIDLSNNMLPEKRLYKIGNGGNRKHCIVCCTPIINTDNKSHISELSQNIHLGLEEVEYNGYFYLFRGGFPNPRGIEVKYAAVPYSFKIFMMLEAYKLGFEKVIWIDAACYPVNDPEPLFKQLYIGDTLFRAFPPDCFDTYDTIVYPQTIDLLNQLSNTDICKGMKINSIVFGLNFSSDKIQNFIEEYYEMVKLGLPFLSSFPEEVVFSAILNKPEYKYVFDNPTNFGYHTLYINEAYINKEGAQRKGYYFLQRNHVSTYSQ